MDPITLALIAIPGLIGDIQSLVNAGADREAIQKAIKESYNVEIPDIDSLMVKATTMKDRPDIQAGETRSAQMDALRQMGNIADKGGFDNGALNTIAQTEGRVGQDVRGMNAANQADLARRGMLGSGLESVRTGQAIQDASNRLSASGNQAAADAQARALQAIGMRSDMASGVRASDEGLGERNRAASMERDRFNAQVANAANQFNSNQLLNRTGAEQARANGINSATNAGVGTMNSSGGPNDRSKEGFEDIGDTINAGRDYLRKKP